MAHPYGWRFLSFILPIQTKVEEFLQYCNYTHHHCALIVLYYRTVILYYIRGVFGLTGGCFLFCLLVHNRCMWRGCNSWRNTFIPLLTALADELQKPWGLYMAYQSSWIHCGIQYPGTRHRISQRMQLWQTYYQRWWEANLVLPWHDALETQGPNTSNSHLHWA